MIYWVFAENNISQPGSSHELIFMKGFNPPRQTKNKLQKNKCKPVNKKESVRFIGMNLIKMN